MRERKGGKSFEWERRLKECHRSELIRKEKAQEKEKLNFQGKVMSPSKSVDKTMCVREKKRAVHVIIGQGPAGASRGQPGQAADGWRKGHLP